MGWKMLVSYLWGVRDEYSPHMDDSKYNKDESIYSLVHPPYSRSPYRSPGYRLNQKHGPGCRVYQKTSPNYRPGSPAFRRKGRLKKQGSVSPNHFSGSRIKPSGEVKPRGIPVRTGTRPSSGSAGDTTPRSSSSKESTPSPVHSPRSSIYGEFSKIPISKSQEDLIKSVHLRSFEGSRGLPRSQSSTLKPPETYSSSSSSRLANSVEVLSSLDSSDLVSRRKPSPGSKLGQSFTSIRPAQGANPSTAQGNKPSSAGSRIPPPTSRSLNRSLPTSNIRSSSSPRLPRTVDRTGKTESRLRTPSQGSNTARGVNTSPGALNSPRKHDQSETMIGQGINSSLHRETFSKSNTKRKLLKTEAEKVLKDQLSRGKIPPRAKFRADDEISIGEPSEYRVIPIHKEESESCSTESKTSPVLGDVAKSGDSTGDTEPSDGRRISITTPNRASKSASLDNYYKPEIHSPKPHKLLSGKGSSSSFFSRLSSLRVSLNGRRSPGVITPHTTSSDTGFFQGISTKPKYSLSPYEIRHGDYLITPPLVKLAKPPKRKRPRLLPLAAGLKRSLSFNDAQLIAQAVTEGDCKLLEDLYPSFPQSENIYTVIKPVKDVDMMVKPVFGGEAERWRAGRRVSAGRTSAQNVSTLIIGKEKVHEDARFSGEVSTPSHPRLEVRVQVSTPSTPSINFYCPQEPSPIISPWGRTSSSSLSSRASASSIAGRTSSVSLNNRTNSRTKILSPVITKPDNVVLVECNGNERGITGNHPFIQRIQNQNSRSNLTQPVIPVSPSQLGPNSQLSISSSSRESDLAPSSSRGLESGTYRTLNFDPFRNILSLADSNISQAESILSSLGCERSGVRSDSDSDPSSLGLSSDIETNIRKLEKTQAKINAALETFRTVQISSASPGPGSISRSEISSPRPSANTLDNAELYIGFPKSLGNRRESRHRVTYPQSKAELKINQRKLSYEISAPEPETKPRKTSLFRRHSFNHNYKEKVQPRHGDEPISVGWGESDSESARTSAVYDDCTFSDSEGSFSPLKNRIRGLLGSFGKGRKKLVKSPKKKELPLSMKDPVESSDRTDLSLSIGQFTELVKSLPANNFSAKTNDLTQSPAFLRPKVPKQHRAVAANNSNDTFSSVSTSQSFNISSNRNSVISAQSVSSESFDNNSASDENGASTGSPPSNVNDDLTPEQRQERKLFFIAREIMSSEKVYVDVLKILNTEFREFVQKARAESKSGILPDQDFVKLFSNLPELMMLNEDLLRDFETRVENWNTIKKIADVIVRKGPYLKLYTVYIRDFSAMNFHFEECCSRYPKFGKLVKEFEKLPRCQRLRLQHYMLKPVQRLPQYRLLLEDYLKHLDPDSPDFDDTTQALHIVSEAAEHANNTVKQGDKFQRMLKLQSRVGDWELIKPGRELVKEGELSKISRKGFGPRYFILVSDCLLYTSYQGTMAGDNTSLKVSYSIMLNQLTVNLPPCQDREYSTEFSITSNVRSCTLRAKDVAERNEWLDALNTAIEDYRSRKATFNIGDTMSLGRGEGKLGESAPVWIPDQRVTMCQVCGGEFNLVVRRHHCRACGKVVCTNCSRNKAPLRYKGWEQHRVCDTCFDQLEKLHGEDEELRSRFKRRDHSRSVGKYIPQRLKLPANSENSEMSGHLRRRLKNSKWKRSWFVLKERVLYIYRASEDTIAAETLPVLGWTLQPLAEKLLLEPGESGFQLSHPNSETLIFVAENKTYADKWIAELNIASNL